MHRELTNKKLSDTDVLEWRIKSIIFGFSIPVLTTLVLFLFRGDEIMWIYRDTSTLNVTSGKIESSLIDYRSGPRSSGWHFIITYTYKVDEKNYTSNRVHYSFTGSSDKAYAEKYINKYPVGSHVVVYYDPEQPKISVLEPAIKDESILYFIASTIVFGLYFVVSSFWIR